MSRMSELFSDLCAIRERDPEELPTTPDWADIHNFKTWAITTYGLEVWNIYITEDWDKGWEI